MYDEQLTWYRDHVDQAAALLDVGDSPHDASFSAPEIAAATVVINALMNYDGSVVKR